VVFGTPVNGDDPLNVLVPDFGPIPAASIPPVKKQKGGKKRAIPSGGRKQSAWDHIVEVTAQLGLVPVWRGFTLFLLEPRALFSSFAGARRMVWGRNISKLGFTRKLTGYLADTIELRSADPSIGRTRWARYPVVDGEPSSGILGDPNSPQPVVSRANRVTPSGRPDERVRVYPARGITDQKTLERLAQNVFEEVGRQEIKGELETDEVESFGSTTEADLLALQPGEPVTIEIALPVAVGSDGPRVPVQSSLQELSGQSVAERAAFLRGLGMSAQTAQRLAQAQEGIQLVSTFRAGHVNLKWSNETGVSVGFDFQNFIVARDAPEELGLQPKVTSPAEIEQ
jgi:hypothetical protein